MRTTFERALVLAVLASGCGDSASPGRKDEPVSPDAGVEAGELAVDGSPPTVRPAPSLPIVLVHASRSFPAFRICPASSEPSALVSRAVEPPYPTARMPGSSLAGVDVSGAVALPPLVGDVSEVVLIPLDADTKSNPLLERGSCRSLVCGGSGGRCIAPAKLRRVAARTALGEPDERAFSRPSTVLVLRDDPSTPGAVYFESRPALRGERDTPEPGKISFLFDNFSDHQGAVTFTGGGQSQGLTSGSEVTAKGPAWETTTFKAGSFEASLVDVHRASDVGNDIDAFYSRRVYYGLFLLGLSTPPVGDEGRALRLVAFPLPPASSTTTPDAGIDDAGLDDAGLDAGSPSDASPDAR